LWRDFKGSWVEREVVIISGEVFRFYYYLLIQRVFNSNQFACGFSNDALEFIGGEDIR
jgi:hypothetical protein